MVFFENPQLLQLFKHFTCKKNQNRIPISLLRFKYPSGISQIRSKTSSGVSFFRFKHREEPKVNLEASLRCCFLFERRSSSPSFTTLLSPNPSFDPTPFFLSISNPKTVIRNITRLPRNHQSSTVKRFNPHRRPP